MKLLFWSAVAGAFIAAGGWVCWIGAADYLLLTSIPILLFGGIILAGTGAPKGRARFLHQTGIVLFLSLLAANVVGYPFREPGLHARMIWGERIAGSLELYRVEKGHYPWSLELLKQWGGASVPDLDQGGVCSYSFTPDDSYELWLYMGYLEARMKTGREPQWADLACW